MTVVTRQVVGWFRNRSSFPAKAGCYRVSRYIIEPTMHQSMYIGNPFLGVKQTEREAELPPPFSVKAENVCVCVCTYPSYAKQHRSYLHLTVYILITLSLLSKYTRFHSIPVSRWALHVEMLRWMRNVCLCFACLLGSNHLYELRADRWGKGL